MAVSYITTGEAIGGNYDTNGDRKQTSVPDYDGEVRLIKRSVSSFLSYLDTTKNHNYVFYRPIDPEEAKIIAELAIRACNNPNIGYSQHYDNSDPNNNRQAIFSHGADANVPINCDCSSLGSYCVSMATGVNIGACNSASIGSAIANTGHFMTVASSRTLTSSNLPYNGDVFVRPKTDSVGGHVFMVVAGNPREGNEDEIVTSSGSTIISGGGLDVASYRDQYGQTYQFTPRKEAPEDINSYYDQDCGVTKNGSYAWGRFSEIARSSCDLCKMEPRRWYSYKEDGYNRGVAPAPGAVMCFTDLYDIEAPGYVCIVEHIEVNQIDVSLVTLDTEQFEYKTMQKREGSWDLDLDGDGIYELRFQGFIYNPAVNLMTYATSARDKFIEVAQSQIDTDGKFTEEQTGISTDTAAWSGAFINAVAKKSGSLLNIVIPNTLSCSDIGRVGVLRNMGIWLEGPAEDRCPEPQVGDIALFRTTGNLDRMNRYAADKAGIIIEVDQASSIASGTNELITYSFKVVIGDWEGQVKEKSYTNASGALSGIFRPNWEQIDGTSGSIQRYANVEGLYTEGTSLEDAAIRDLRYVSLTKNGFEPSIQSTELKLCSINYTGMLANLYSAFAEVSSSSATDANLVVDLWNNSVKSVFQNDEYLMVSVVGESVTPDMETGTYVANDSTLNAGGSVEATSTELTEQVSVVVPSPTIAAQSEIVDSTPTIVSKSEFAAKLGTKLEVTTAYEDTSITRTITLNNTVKMIYDILYGELGNPAGVLGIMANMFQESSFVTGSASTKAKSYGLIHWSGSRGLAMKAYCRTHGNNSEWSQNLSGQLSYLFYESNLDKTLFKGMETIKKVASNVDGAVRATRIFLDYFILGGPNCQGTLQEVREYNLRIGWAKGLWTLIFGGKG